MQNRRLDARPLTLAILVFAFGALVAAGLPLLGNDGVIATLGLVGPMSQLIPVDQTISNVILLVGLAVGVDYSLFYLKRVREERAAGRSNEAAIEAAAATSGRAVLVSGLTVMIAMAGMYLAGSPTFLSLATGAILVVAVSVLGSLSVLPAALSALGDRVERGRIPFAGRFSGERGIWGRIVEAVLRRPLASALACTGVLLALAFPALAMKVSLPGEDSLSRNIPAVRATDHLRAAFPSENAPAYVVVEGRDVTAPAVAGGIQRLQRALAQHPGLFPGRASIDIARDRTVARIAIPSAGSGIDATSKRMLATLRAAGVATVGSVPGTRASIDGFAAQTADFNASLERNTPIVFAFVLGAAFLLLLVTFRSLVIPVKAIALNLLSVGAAYGVLVLVLAFQDRDGFIVAWLPLFLFVVVRAVDGLPRVRPEPGPRGLRPRHAHRGRGRPRHQEHRRRGHQRGARDGRRLRPVRDAGQRRPAPDGRRLAVAVALDATIIRGVLLPASMKLLGDWNWWLPRKLDWLPRASLEGEAAPAEA